MLIGIYGTKNMALDKDSPYLMYNVHAYIHSFVYNFRCEANGKWTRVPDLRCEIIQCPAPQPPAAGMVNGHNYQVGRKVTIDRRRYISNAR